MIGFYDYTVWLTYLSLISAVAGIAASLSGVGHPYFGMLFLLISGLCDTFDGKVARTKKNRTEEQKRFGIQIDSLSDLVAFGVLPAYIAISVSRVSPKFDPISFINTTRRGFEVSFVLMIIVVFYVLAALIRLAYFNVLAEEKLGTGGNTSYVGLPVTSAALIFPVILLIRAITPLDLTAFYYGTLLITGILFLCKFKIKKPGNKAIAIMLILGAIEFILLIVVKFYARLPW